MLTSDNIRTIIKQRKAETKISWQKIAKKAGISQFTLSKYIHKNTDMRTELVIYVLEALGLELCIKEKSNSNT